MSFETGNQLGLKHGLSKTATYRKWVCMKWRHLNLSAQGRMAC